MLLFLVMRSYDGAEGSREGRSVEYGVVQQAQGVVKGDDRWSHEVLNGCSLRCRLLENCLFLQTRDARGYISVSTRLGHLIIIWHDT